MQIPSVTPQKLLLLTSSMKFEGDNFTVISSFPQKKLFPAVRDQQLIGPIWTGILVQEYKKEKIETKRDGINRHLSSMKDFSWELFHGNLILFEN